MATPHRIGAARKEVRGHLAALVLVEILAGALLIAVIAPVSSESLAWLIRRGGVALGRVLPATLRLAAGATALLGLVGVALVLRLFTRWLHAVPVLLFEKLEPRDCLRRSAELVRARTEFAG